MALLVVAWLVSPIILLPLFISRSNKLEKHRAFIEQLRRQGRISEYEYTTLNAFIQQNTRQTANFAPYRNNAANYQPDQPGRVSAPVVMGPPPAPEKSELIGPPLPNGYRRENSASAVQTNVRTVKVSAVAPNVRNSNTPVPDFPPKAKPAKEKQTAPKPADGFTYVPQQTQTSPTYTYNYTQSAPPAPKPKKERNTASILMGIGAALVVLAGMVLSNAAWLSMGDWGRVGMIALMSLFFFGCSAFSLKKLKLENTSMAFYLLGSVFVGITFVTMGYFGLIGNWLSVSGDGFWLLYSAATLLITVMMTLASKIYHKGGFVHAALYSGLVSFTLMSVQLIDNRHWWAFALNVISAVPIFLLHSESVKFGKTEKDPLRLFTVIMTTVYAMTALPYMLIDIAGKWDVPELLTAVVWFVQVTYYGWKSENQLLRFAQASGRTVIAAELACIAVTDSMNTRTLVFAVCTFVIALAWHFVPKLRSGWSDGVDCLSMLAALFAYRVYDEISTYVLDMSLALMLTALIAIKALSANSTVGTKRTFKYLLPLSSALSAMTVSSLIAKLAGVETSEGEMLSQMLPMILICFGLAFLFMHIDTIRTIVSDVTFPSALFGVGIVLISYADTDRSFILAACAFLLTAVLMLIHSAENSGAGTVMKHLLILPFTAICLCIAQLPDFGTSDTALSSQYRLTVLGAMLFIMSLIFRYSDKVGANIRTLVSDLGFTFGVFAAALSLFSWESSPLAAAMLILTAVSAITFIFERKPKRRPQLIVMRNLLPVTLLGSAGMLFSDDSLLFNSFTPYILYLGLVYIVMLAGFDRVHKLRTRLSDFLLPTVAFLAFLAKTVGIDSDHALSELYAALAVSLIVPLFVTWQGCEKDEGRHLIVHRMLAPFLMLSPAAVLSAIFRNENSIFYSNTDYYTVIQKVFLTVTIAVMLIAAAFTLRSERENSFRGFNQSKYVWTFAAGLFIQFAVLRTASPIIIAVFLLSAVLYMLCQRHENVLISALAVTAFLRSGAETASYIALNSESLSDDDALLIMTFCMSAMLACGRLLYRDSVITKKEIGHFKADTAAFGMAVTPFMAISCGADERFVQSSALILSAAFFANLVRRESGVTFRRIIMTVTSGLLLCLVYTRPFLIFEDAAMNAKINLIPLVAFGLILRWVWRENEKLASNMSFGAHTAALGFLILDALMHQSLGNTLFVLITTLVILLISFAKKNGRWFAVSGASFLGLTFYVTRSFFGRAEWWVYLLAAGIILIVVASVNEYLKSNGTSLKDKFQTFKSRWNK